MRHTVVFFAVFLMVPSAFGQGQDVSECKQIRKGDVTACASEVARACAAKSGYWDKKNCERDITVKHNSCENGVYAKVCEPIQKNYWDVCRKAHDLDMNNEKSIAEWKRRLLAYTQAKAAHDSFHGQWSPCYGAAKECQASSAWHADCDKAGEVFKKTFQSAVDFYLGTPLDNDKLQIQRMLDSKDYQAAISLAQLTAEKVQMFVDLNRDLPLVRYKDADAIAARKGFDDISAKAKLAYEKSLASARCPKGKNNSKSVVKQLTPAVAAFFRGPDDNRGALKVLRLNGKKQTRRDTVRRQSEEAYPAVACVEKTKPSETFCQSFSITARRIKPDGGGWGPWQVYVGESQRLLCKNVR